jgi:selenocysteine-specific elongation factor
MHIARLVLGMAGHTDHGKTSLVRLLTGMDTMRLKEERERGLTIDMGFASFELPDGRRAGIIDVPGHERYIRNMVAGAAGVDIVIFVVAADDGVMPQTREHLDILELLGKQSGMVVLTKSDLVDAEILALAEEEVRGLVHGTFLEDAPVISLSTVTHEGFQEFWGALCSIISRTLPRPDTGPFRMSVQRVFSSAGAGTVVTGISSAGRVRVGDMLEVLPSGVRGRVRAIQAYHRKIPEAAAGHSTALNLAGVARTKVFRGNVMAKPGAFTPTRFFSGRLRLLPYAPAITSGDTFACYFGTDEVHGRVRLLFDNKVQMGQAFTLKGTSPPVDRQAGKPAPQSAFAQLILERPVAAAPGERFLLRRISPRTLVAGGIVLTADRGKTRRGKPKLLNDLLGWEAALDNAAAMTEHLLRIHERPVRKQAMCVNTGLLPAEIDAALRELSAAGRVILDPAESSAVHQESIARLSLQVMEAIRKYREKFPFRIGIPAAALRKQLNIDRRHLDYVLDTLHADGRVVRRPGTVSLAGAVDEMSAHNRALIHEVEKNIKAKGFRGPQEKTLIKAFNGNEAEVREAVGHLVESGRVVQMHGYGSGNEKYIFHADIVARAREVVIENCRTKGRVRFIDLKADLGTSFAYAVALIQYFRKIRLVRPDGASDVLTSAAEEEV